MPEKLLTPTRRPVVFVTGARRGIGRGIAYGMAEHGFDVVVNDIVDDEAMQETLAGLRSRGAGAAMVVADIAQVEHRAELAQRAFAAFGTVDCLVNNAGVQVDKRGDMLQASPESFDRVMSVNLRGTFFLTQAIASRMLEEQRTETAPYRCIIMLTSANAVAASPQHSEYCISKAALTMVTKTLALRLAPHRIYVHEVRPGITRSDLSGALSAQYDRITSDPEVVPLMAWGEAAGVGKAVAALATGAFPFSTGDAINVDGGMHIPKFTASWDRT